MDEIAERYASRAVRSIFLYTREAHPAENYRHHTSMEVKRANARALQSAFGMRRKILLDDLEGAAHRAYGLLPNMTWIIGRGGVILYKAEWTSPRDVEGALDTLLEDLDRRVKDKLVPFYSERLGWRPRDEDRFREGLERNGPQAVKDFYRKKP